MIDRPHTIEELNALPVSPEFDTLVIEFTEAELAQGFCLIKDKKYMIPEGNKAVRIPSMRPIMLFWSEPNETIYWTDENGTLWNLGKYADGTWYKQRKW